MRQHVPPLKLGTVHSEFALAILTLTSTSVICHSFLSFSVLLSFLRTTITVCVLRTVRHTLNLMPSTMLSAATTLLAVLSLLPTNPLSSAFAAPNAQPAAPLHFPLLRRNAQPKSATDYASIADNLRLKYGRPAVNPASKLRRAGNVANIATTNQQADSSYFAPIQVGTPYVCLTFFSVCQPAKRQDLTPNLALGRTSLPVTQLT